LLSINRSGPYLTGVFSFTLQKSNNRKEKISEANGFACLILASELYFSDLKNCNIAGVKQDRGCGSNAVPKMLGNFGQPFGFGELFQFGATSVLWWGNEQLPVRKKYISYFR